MSYVVGQVRSTGLPPLPTPSLLLPYHKSLPSPRRSGQVRSLTGVGEVDSSDLVIWVLLVGRLGVLHLSPGLHAPVARLDLGGRPLHLRVVKVNICKRKGPGSGHARSGEVNIYMNTGSGHARS